MSSSSDSRREIQLCPDGRSRIESLQSESSNDEPLGRRFMSKQSDSKSLTRTSKSAKPKISLARLSPIVSSDDAGDSNQGTTTKFTLKDLNRMANLYPWPKGVTLCLPVENGDSLAKYPDSLVVHEESLKAGFRLPIPTFVRDFLKWTELCPAQISPNSWRYFSAYGIRCWEMNKEPTFLGMQYLFDMMEKGKVFVVYTRNLDIMSKLNSGVKDWKNKWFLVKKGDGYDFNFPIHPGIGVKFKKGVDEIKEISGEEKELRDAFVSSEQTNLHHSQLVTHENLENAGLSLPHPRQPMKPGLSLIKSAIRKQNNLKSSRSESKKTTVGSRSPPEKGEERPTKKRFKLVQISRKAENIVTTPVQDTPKSPIHQLHIATDSPLSPEGRPNYLASSLTLEEANGLLKGATVNVDAVSILKRLPDEQASAEFARAVALQVYHANNLIEKHEKLLSSHLGSHAKLEGLQEEKKELKQELLCAKESAKRNEESMKKRIQSLEDNLKKTQEENAEQRQKIMELKMDLSKAKDVGKEEFLNSNGFYRRVAHFNATYYMSGLRVGVCQAVKKYQHLDPKIVEFEPDFDDDCGYEVPDPPPYSSPIRLVPYP